MQQRRKAFTLIELLAVIVILAIIALIAVPVIMNIITKSQKNAFKDSAYGIIKAGELYYTNSLLEIEGMQEDKIFTFPDDMENLEIDGSKPTGGIMMVNKEGKVALAITDGKYCVTKYYDDEDININEDALNCFMPYSLGAVATTSETLGITQIDPCIKKGTICNTYEKDVTEPTEFAIQVNDNEVYKFYVIDDTGSEITLIMDRNLYKSTDANNGYVAWINETDYIEANKDDKTNCSSTACNDEGPITALNILKQRTSNWTNILEKNYIISDDVGNQYSSVTMNMRARMLTYTEAKTLGCGYTSASCPKYLWENLGHSGAWGIKGYWLSSASSTYDDTAWFVFQPGYVHSTNVYSNSYVYYEGYGVRPVITLAK